jgi:hypothetical protein
LRKSVVYAAETLVMSEAGEGAGEVGRDGAGGQDSAQRRPELAEAAFTFRE